MSRTFIAQPEILRFEGNSVLDKASEFKQNVDKIYSTIEEMINSSYMSPAASAIAQEIKSYKDELDKMTRAIDNYGEYCVKSANVINKNEQNIIDNTNNGTIM